MRTLAVSLTLLATILAAMSFGMVAGYGLILGILKLMVRARAPRAPALPPLVADQRAT